MRLTTEFFVAALIRRVNGEGGFAYLVRRGAGEAGTLFIQCRRDNGLIDLYGPAPQSFYKEEESNNERLFIPLIEGGLEQESIARLEKELRFDLDIWLVEIENYPYLETLFQVVTDP